jgi:hypothetical protein
LDRHRVHASSFVPLDLSTLASAHPVRRGKLAAEVGMSPAAPLRRDIEARIERVAALIGGARRLIREGQALDLAVLEYATRDLRDVVRVVPADATEGLAAYVGRLRAELDALAEDLLAAGGDARGAIAERRRSAFKAYDSGNDGR